MSLTHCSVCRSSASKMMYNASHYSPLHLFTFHWKATINPTQYFLSTIVAGKRRNNLHFLIIEKVVKHWMHGRVASILSWQTLLICRWAHCSSMWRWSKCCASLKNPRFSSWPVLTGAAFFSMPWGLLRWSLNHPCHHQHGLSAASLACFQTTETQVWVWRIQRHHLKPTKTVR